MMKHVNVHTNYINNKYELHRKHKAIEELKYFNISPSRKSNQINITTSHSLTTTTVP